MKALQENVVLVFNGELLAVIRRDVEKTKKTIIYKVEEMSPEDIQKLINKDEVSNNKSGDV